MRIFGRKNNNSYLYDDKAVSNNPKKASAVEEGRTEESPKIASKANREQGEPSAEVQAAILAVATRTERASLLAGNLREAQSGNFLPHTPPSRRRSAPPIEKTAAIISQSYQTLLLCEGEEAQVAVSKSAGWQR